MEEQNKGPLQYFVVLSGGQGEIEEKKSRFIGHVRPVHSEQEAVEFIEGIKKKYWDARHHCSAFVIGSRQELTRCSDDGEPSGTAGRPMLEVLLGLGLCNVVVVVTRYFGGTLLGTGGLVRAYTQAVKAGLKNCELGVMRLGKELRLTTDYTGIGKIQYLLGRENIAIADSEYAADVTLKIVVGEEKTEELCKQLTEVTNGQIKIEKLQTTYFVDKERVLEI